MCRLKKHAYAELPPSENRASQGKNVCTNMRNSAFPRALFMIVIISSHISLNICFGCSKELSHCDGSIEHPKHMFSLRNKENNFQISTLVDRPRLVLLILR